MTEPLDCLKAALADRYVLDREIGAGGMATVYLAEDLRHHRKVAVKVLRPDLAASLGVERFNRETTSPPTSSIPTSSHSSTPGKPMGSSTTSCPTWRAPPSGVA